MERARLILTSGLEDGQIFLDKSEEYDGAIRDTYREAMQLVDSRADWLKSMHAARDFDNNMTIVMTFRIGPIAKWTKEYLEEQRAQQLPEQATP